VCHIDIKVNGMDTPNPAPAEVTPEVVVLEAPKTEVIETIGQVLETSPAKSEPETVPLAAFLDLKKDNKQLHKDIADIKASINDGATKAEVSADIAAIGEKYGVDSSFLGELASVIRKETGQDIEAKIQPLTAKEKADHIEGVFSTHFDKALADMPEYSAVVNRDVIKTLSLDPRNQNKTFAQLIEDTYAKAIPQGKRTLEGTTHRGGKGNDPVDVDRARNDSTYLTEVLSNPETKAEYNKGLLERIGNQL